MISYDFVFEQLSIPPPPQRFYTSSPPPDLSDSIQDSEPLVEVYNTTESEFIIENVDEGECVDGSGGVTGGVDNENIDEGEGVDCGGGDTVGVDIDPLPASSGVSNADLDYAEQMRQHEADLIIYQQQQAAYELSIEAVPGTFVWNFDEGGMVL